MIRRSNIGESLSEELEVISAIYADEFSILEPESRVYEIKIRPDIENISKEEHIILKFQHINGYPSTKPLKYELHAPWLKYSVLSELEKQLELIVLSSLGSPVVHLLVECIRSFMLDNLSSNTEKHTIPGVKVPASGSVNTGLHKQLNAVVSVPSVKFHLDISPDILSFASNSKAPTIYHGEPFVDRKSIFQAHSWRISSKEADCDDDGETHAGGRLLHLLTLSGIEKIAVMVSRWFGGIQLGPDRFKHINNVARLLLTEQNFLSNSTVDSNVRKQEQHKKDRNA
ncbi:unnamed protein product [Heterobilharzia americana]|nr:unnamed protein product [Heterobilharzia americana]